jgi:integration host factor subunit beta
MNPRRLGSRLDSEKEQVHCNQRFNGGDWDMTMTKADLVDQVANQADIPRKQADQVVQVILESITAALLQGEKVELRGFGSFRIRQRGQRIGRNPKTGERVEVPPKKIPYFKPGKHLRETLLKL